jgi:hypothetical protein
MKKHLYIFGLLMAVFGFSACNGDYDDWAAPQSNAQEDAITIPGYTAAAAGAIDLNQAGESINMFTLSSAALPEGSTVENNRVKLTPTGEGVKDELSKTIELTADCKADSAALQALVENAFGKRPVERIFKAHVYSNVNYKGDDVYVDAGEVNVSITPAAPNIEPVYYLVGDVAGGWTKNNILKFTRSDKDIYEDPYFTVTFKTTAANQYWKIVPQSNVDNDDLFAAGALGTVKDGDKSLSGKLTINYPGAGVVEKPGSYAMVINMLTNEYTIVKTDLYYMVGNMNGWTAEAAKKSLFIPSGSTTATYTGQFNGSYDLKIWNKEGLGNFSVAWGSAVDGATDETGTLQNSEGQAFAAPTQNEFYTLTINMGNNTYSWTKLENQSPDVYTKIGLIGAFNSWSTDLELEKVNDHNWYIHNATVGGELKFRSNGNWDSANWGISGNTTNYNTLGATIYGSGVTSEAKNINIPEGTYDVYFCDITGQFAFVPVED